MRTPRRGSHAGRGQTNIDFLIGVVVFVVTVAFVVGFVPAILAPYTDHAARPVLAGRIADELVYESFADATDPGALDPACTLAFFGAGTAAGCSFDASDALTERVGVSSRYALNVTVERSDGGARTAACAAANGTVQPCEVGGTRLATGPVPPASGESVVTAARPARLGNADVVVVVRVW